MSNDTMQVTEIEIGHSVRRWTRYAVSGELTLDDVRALRGDDEDAALAVARRLNDLGVLVEQYSSDDDLHDPFDEGSEPSVISCTVEEWELETRPV